MNENNNQNGFSAPDTQNNPYQQNHNFGNDTNQQNFNANNMNYQSFNSNEPVNNGNSGTTLWLILGIVQMVTLLCCCSFHTFATGLITVLMVKDAEKSLNAGDYAKYQKGLKDAKIVNLVGWGLVLLTVVIGVIYGFLGFVICF